MRAWTRPVAAITAGTVVLLAFMLISDTGPNVPLLLALCVLVGVGLWLLSDLMDASFEAAEFVASPHVSRAQAIDRRVMRLRSGLVYGRRDDVSLDRLRTGLVELVDDQLLAAYQIDRVEDPAAARAVLGDELFAFVDDPKTAHGLARPQQLDRILTLIEQI